MYQKLSRILRNLHRGQKGMTGLETAIILIAFVTVASVLAYSVLSAGIFSAERGKATVYGGLEAASATLEVKGSVTGNATSSGNVSLDSILFLIGLTMPDESVDMSAVAVNVFSSLENAIMTDETWDGTVGVGKWQFLKLPDSAERGATSELEGDEIFMVLIDISDFDTIGPYEWFVVELVPPTGATVTIKRTLPGNLKAMMDLK